MSEHSEFVEQIGLDLEGELSAAESRRLADHLEGCADCSAARARELRLRQALGEARVAVDPGFTARVMDALPQPEWKAAPAAAARTATASPRRALAWAVGLFAVLAVVSGVLLTAALGGESGMLGGLPGGGLLAAVGQMAVAAVVTGAGLLGASWAGVGLAVGEMFRAAPGTLVAFALLLAFLSGLLFIMLRRPKPAAARRRSSE